MYNFKLKLSFNFNFAFTEIKMSYNTKQSAELLSFLKENGNRHMTADEVYAEMRQKGSTVGRTTVYRHLDRLYADGVIRKYLSILTIPSAVRITTICAVINAADLFTRTVIF